MKLSEWQKGCSTPYIRGVYERTYGEGSPNKNHYSYWNGVWWCSFCWDKEEAIAVSKNYGPSYDQDLKWRGVIEE